MGNRRRATALLTALLAGLLAVGFLTSGDPPRAHGSLDRGEIVSREHLGISYYLYAPLHTSSHRPTTVLVGLRGIGDRSQDFARSLAAEAEGRGWLLVVPAFSYGDWRKMEMLRSEARQYLPWLKSLLDTLPEEAGLELGQRVLLYGFSRGAQEAHRFAFMYPHQVLGVATMGAGTYTLPIKRTLGLKGPEPLEFPVGVGDLERYSGKGFDLEALKQVPFWVGVGERDDQPADVPHDWDSHIGDTRLERAQVFTRVLSCLGVSAQLAVIPKLGHGESAESRAAALAFLQGLETN